MTTIPNTYNIPQATLSPISSFQVFEDCSDKIKGRYVQLISFLINEDLEGLKKFNASLPLGEFENLLNIRIKEDHFESTTTSESEKITYRLDLAHEAKNKEAFQYLVEEGLDYQSPHIDRQALIKSSFTMNEFSLTLYLFELGLANWDDYNHLDEALFNGGRANRYDMVSRETLTDLKTLITRMVENISPEQLQKVEEPLLELMRFPPQYVHPEDFEEENVFLKKATLLLLEKGVNINQAYPVQYIKNERAPNPEKGFGPETAICKVAEMENDEMFNFLAHHQPSLAQYQAFAQQLKDDPKEYNKVKYLNLLQTYIEKLTLEQKLQEAPGAVKPILKI